MSTPHIYTALGDSLTFGTGAQEHEGFVRRFHSALARMHPNPVILHQYGKVGATTSELLAKVQTNETLRSHLRDADIITVTAGGNDIIQAAQQMYMQGVLSSMKPAMRLFFRAYEKLLKELFQLNNTQERNSRIILLEIYNPLPMFRDAVLWVRFLNRCIARAAEPYGNSVRLATVYPAFLGHEEELISDDGVHPNADGYALLADRVKEAFLSFTPAGGDGTP